MSRKKTQEEGRRHGGGWLRFPQRDRGGTPDPATYFRRTPLILKLLIGGVNAFHAWTFFAPQTIPYDNLGPLGTLTKYLLEHYNTPLRIWFVTIWILHTLFAFIVLKLCKEKGITDRMTQVRWFAQTVTYGLNSLFFLWIYKPPMKSK